jgi:hypothetical protein
MQQPLPSCPCSGSKAFAQQLPPIGRALSQCRATRQRALAREEPVGQFQCAYAYRTVSYARTFWENRRRLSLLEKGCGSFKQNAPPIIAILRRGAFRGIASAVNNTHITMGDVLEIEEENLGGQQELTADASKLEGQIHSINQELKGLEGAPSIPLQLHFFQRPFQSLISKSEHLLFHRLFPMLKSDFMLANMGTQEVIRSNIIRP